MRAADADDPAMKNNATRPMIFGLGSTRPHSLIRTAADSFPAATADKAGLRVPLASISAGKFLATTKQNWGGPSRTLPKRFLRPRDTFRAAVRCRQLQPPTTERGLMFVSYQKHRLKISSSL